MLIRNAEHKDLPVILHLMNDAILYTTSIYDYNIRNTAFIESWFAKKKADNFPVLVVEENGETIAYGSYGSFRLWAAYKFTVEHSIYVLKQSQGKGIGKILLSSLITKARIEGYHTMIAGIDSDNAVSYNFHSKLGFKEVARFKEVGYKFERWLDLTFMQLML